jgi:hypothetical protein
LPPNDAAPPRLDVRPTGWAPSAAQLADLAALLLQLANREREQDAQRPAAPAGCAAAVGQQT